MVTRHHRAPVCAILVSAWLLAWVPTAAVGQPSEYAIGPQDVLTIAVWDQADLSGKFTVGSDGAISFPLVGTVRVAGLTASAVKVLLEARLADGYLKNPQVTVEVSEHLSQRVFLMGEVKAPGPLPLTGAMTLLEALTRAGGVTESAGGELVVLRSGAAPSGTAGPLAPGAAGVTEVTRIDVGDLRTGALTRNVTLQHGDTVFVPRAEAYYVLGQVHKPGSYTLEQGTTVLKAISLAGGVTPLGSTSRIRIVRIVDGKKVEIKAKLDDVVKAGDTVTVGTRWM